MGVFLLLGGLAYRRRLKAKAGACVKTYGTIVGNTKGLSGGFETAPVYYPEVEYYIGNLRFSFTGETGYGQPKREGTKIAVMYDEANPSIAFMVEDYYAGANMVLGTGGIFMLVGSINGVSYAVSEPMNNKANQAVDRMPADGRLRIRVSRAAIAHFSYYP